jgi:UDP-N-acetylglucosamine 2-epimerase (non-hydrolysing)
MEILVAFGTRPEWLKIKPLINQFKIDDIKYKLFFTGQHTDLLKDVEVDFRLNQENLCENRLNSIIANVLTHNLPTYFTHVLVQGDTSSAFAAALWAFNNQIKIIHLEAGLRTNNLEHPYPEEANRQLISRIADIHLCATYKNKYSLNQENITNRKYVYVVGNTVLDNIFHIETTYGNKVLVTLHRRENHDIIEKWFEEIDNIAKEYSDLEFILPIHPNPNVLKHKDIFKYVKVVDPLSHKELINILKDCKFTITDSGGIQEEASFLNKKIIICRETTEREECLAHHGVLCVSPSDLNNHVKEIINNYEVNVPCPFGNGQSSEMITKILKTYDDTKL